MQILDHTTINIEYDRIWLRSMHLKLNILYSEYISLSDFSTKRIKIITTGLDILAEVSMDANPLPVIEEKKSTINTTPFGDSKKRKRNELERLLDGFQWCLK
jgi:hypothetical protein